MSKKCMNCGELNDDIASWCTNCHGTKFKKTATRLQNFEIDTDDILDVEKIEELSFCGNKNASYFLGKIYLFGLYNIKQDIEKARQIFTELQKIEYKDSDKYLQVCDNSSYNIERLLLKNNKRTFPAFICKHCESIIPINKLKSNKHRTVQVYGTSFFDTLGKQFLLDTFLSDKHLACPYCFQEDLLILGTPLAESLIKKHSDNQDYRNILLFEYDLNIPANDEKFMKDTSNIRNDKKFIEDINNIRNKTGSTICPQCGFVNNIDSLCCVKCGYDFPPYTENNFQKDIDVEKDIIEGNDNKAEQCIENNFQRCIEDERNITKEDDKEKDDSFFNTYFFIVLIVIALFLIGHFLSKYI